MQLKPRQKQIILMFLLVIIVFVLVRGYISQQKKAYILSSYENEPMEIQDYTPEITALSPKKIIIHIEGAVNEPGLYELLEDSRINDAINIAGGLKDSADRKRINLARRISDEEYIYIPQIGEEIEVTDINISKEFNEVVNINNANREELQSLVGIGPALADRIIDYRNENGKFDAIDEILKVSGIGDKKFSDIKDSIMVN